MKKINENINRPDAFSTVFKQKLTNHQSPVDPECWDEIDQRLHRKGKRKVAWWLWVPLGSVAVVALMFTLLPVSEPDRFATHTPINKVSQPTLRTEKQLASAPRNVAWHPSKKQTHLSSTLPTIAVKESTVPTIAVKESFDKPVSDKETIFDELVEIKTINIDTVLLESKSTDLSTTQFNHQLAMQQSTDSAALSPLKESVLPNLNTAPDWAAPKNKNQSNWLLAASFGSGGSGLLKNESAPLTFRDISKILSETKPMYANRQPANDFNKTNYKTPLSFGLNVGKQLNKSLRIETGFMYTYLLTTFENTSEQPTEQRKDAKLHLHYIGLPINLVVRLWEKPKWEVYVSGGAMVEKGLQSLYVENQYYGNSVYTTTAREKIDGLQVSINSSVGITYKLQRTIGIYFEPKFSYFFDNDQPASVRTNKAVSLGLVAGLRLNL